MKRIGERAGFARRQAILVAGVTTALLVAAYTSYFVGEALRGIPFLFPEPPYLNVIIIAAYVLYMGVGALTVFAKHDATWPVFMLLVGLWLLVVFFDGSFIQYFVFQFGVNLEFLRVRPIPLIAGITAVVLSILLHVNQLSARIVELLRERGVDEAEIEHLPDHVQSLARSIGLTIIGWMSVIALVLFIGDLVLGRATLGLRGLGIMAGFGIVVALAFLLSRMLTSAAHGEELLVLDAERAATVRGASQDPAPRRPPRGLGGR